MINVRELRLGNLIEYLDCEDNWIDNYVDYDDIRWLSEEENDPCYRPKVLTDDLLVRMGFEKETGDKENHWLRLRTHNHTFEADQSTDYEIVYVSVQGYLCGFAQQTHQLQNLYFALTGEELTIKEANDE